MMFVSLCVCVPVGVLDSGRCYGLCYVNQSPPQIYYHRLKVIPTRVPLSLLSTSPPPPSHTLTLLHTPKHTLSNIHTDTHTHTHTLKTHAQKLGLVDAVTFSSINIH